MAAKQLAFIWAYFKLNLASAMEYRFSFITQCFGMLVNDGMIFFFWWLYFRSFPQVAGWGLRDILLLWGVIATSYGLAAIIFGNCILLARIISQGQLDYYLGLPQDVLLHVLVSRMQVSAWGDLVFGLLALGVAAWLGVLPIPLALLLIILSGAVFVGFDVLVGSLAFFIGNAEAAASQAQNALMNFSLYPGSIFHGWVKVLLLTAIPAGFVGHIPVELLREFDLGRLAMLLGFAAFIWLIAIAAFRLGLRRYESGNLIVMRG